MLHSPTKWNEADLLTLVREGVEEGPELEYKRCAALQKNDERKKLDVSKDVSALANSAGGTIVYGMIEEGNVPKGLDQGFNPIDISKEWLEQVILGTIRPRLNDITINPVNLVTHASGRVAYVVHVPQSHTAHQASDKKYYKRFNFQATAMEDYEIRDIMNRMKHPILIPDFSLRDNSCHDGPSVGERDYWLDVDLMNQGQVRAQYLKIVLTAPKQVSGAYLAFSCRSVGKNSVLFGNEWNEYVFQGSEHIVFPDDALRLRDIGCRLSIKMDIRKFKPGDGKAVFIFWKVYADDMPATTGHLYLNDLFKIPDSFEDQVANTLGQHKNMPRP